MSSSKLKVEKTDVLKKNLWDAVTKAIAEKVNVDLAKSPTYIQRFLALRGILQMAVRCSENNEDPLEFWGEKYTLAKASLKEYGFSDDDKSALGQLNNVMTQIQKKGQIEADATCWLCGKLIGDLDDGQWDWTGGDIACLKCIGIYGKESSIEQIKAIKEKENLKHN